MRRLDEAEQDAAAAQGQEWVAQLTSRLSRHLGDYEAGHLTSAGLAARGGEDIHLFYGLAYREGKRAAGDPAVLLTATDRAILSRLVRDETDFLRQFGDDMDAGRGRLAYHTRMAMYGAALREVFWVGWVTGDLRLGRDVRWTLGPTEHCDDCLRFSQRGWLPVATFYRDILGKGYTPQSGMLDCKGFHCQCVLQERWQGIVRTPRFAVS
jgi:hypothetical protein